MVIKRNDLYVTRTKILSKYYYFANWVLCSFALLNVELEKPRKKEIQNILVFP